MSAAGSNGAWSAGAADIPWGAPPPLSPLSPPAPPAFPGQVDDDDDSMRDAAEDDDTRSPLRFATAAAAATSTGAASASAAAPADPPSLSIRPGFSGGIGGGGGGGGGGTGGGQREISEETYGQLEAAAFALSFAEFCNRLEAAKRAAGAQGKVDAYFYARDFKGRLQRKHRELTPPGGLPEPSLYPLFRLLLPKQDPRAGKYRILAKQLGPIYCRAASIPNSSEDKMRLLNFQNEKYNKEGAETSDFGGMLEAVLRSRIDLQRSALTLKDIDDVLNAIVECGTNLGEKAKIFERRFYDLPAREHKWLVRIILGDMKIGLQKDTALKVFGEDGAQRLDANHDLRRLCAEFALKINSGINITLLAPFEVHLAKKVKNPSKALEEMNGEAFVMERKIDGERYCVHKRGQSFTMISRNRRPARQEYYNHFAHVFAENLLAEDCVLDGEVVAIHKQSGEHEAFGHNKTVAINKASLARNAAGIAQPGAIDRGGSTGSAAPVVATDGVIVADETHELLYIAFDVVYLAGKGAAEVFRRAGLTPCEPHDVCKLPLYQRRALLTALVKPKRDLLELIDHRVVPGQEEAGARLKAIADFLQAGLDKGWEGLVLKRLDKPYQTGKRSREGGGWVKLKPDYAEETEELDLVLLAGLYGEGKRRGIARFVLGVIAEDHGAGDGDDDDDDGGGGGGGGGGAGGYGGVKAEDAKGGGGAMLAPSALGRGISASSVTLTQPSQRNGGKRASKWPGYQIGPNSTGAGTGSGGRRFRFHSFCRCSARHLRDQDRQMLLDHLKDHWVEGGPERGVPPWMMPWKPSKEDYPNLWIHPDHAVVLSVKAAELCPSKSYSINYTLRFPRITRLRPDKGVRDAMDEAQFRLLRQRPLSLSHTAVQQQARAQGGGNGGGAKGKRGGGGPRKQTFRAANIVGHIVPQAQQGAQGRVFAGLRAVVLRGTYLSSHPKAAEYIPGARKLPRSKPPAPSSGGGDGAVSAPATAPAQLEVTRQDVVDLFVAHGGDCEANAIGRPRPAADYQEEEWAGDEEEEEEGEGGGAGGGCGGGKKRKRGQGQGKAAGGNTRGGGGGLMVLGGMGVGGKGGGGSQNKKKAVATVERVPIDQDFLIGPSVSNQSLTAAKDRWDADIYTLDWLLDCIQADKRLAPKHEHLIAATEATERRLLRSLDCYGDPLAEEGDVAELRKALTRLPADHVPDLPWRACAELCLHTLAERDALTSAHNLFWRPNWVLYVDRYADPGPPGPPGSDDDDAAHTAARTPLPFTTLDAAATLLRLHGAVVSPTLHADVTTIIVDKRCPQRFAMLKGRLDELRRAPWEAAEKLVVDRAWVEECAQRCRIVDKEQRHYVSLYAVRAESVAEKGQERPEEEEG